jgi:hypothetical protein
MAAEEMFKNLGKKSFGKPPLLNAQVKQKFYLQGNYT